MVIIGRPPRGMTLPSPGVAETLRKSHGVSQLVGAVVGTLDLLDPECQRVERGSRCRAVRKDFCRSPNRVRRVIPTYRRDLRKRINDTWA